METRPLVVISYGKKQPNLPNIKERFGWLSCGIKHKIAGQDLTAILDNPMKVAYRCEWKQDGTHASTIMAVYAQFQFADVVAKMLDDIILDRSCGVFGWSVAVAFTGPIQHAGHYVNASTP